ncbi:MAG: sigma factor [Oscillospiraceae bacterium]
MDDEKITALFWERSQTALELLEKKYGGILRSAALNVLKDPRDAEEVVSDTYMKLWDSIPPQRPRQLHHGGHGGLRIVDTAPAAPAAAGLCRQDKPQRRPYGPEAKAPAEAGRQGSRAVFRTGRVPGFLREHH